MSCDNHLVIHCLICFVLLVTYDDFCYQLINIRSFPFSTMMNQISVFIHVFMECIREDDVLQFWIMSNFPVLLKVYKMA